MATESLELDTIKDYLISVGCKIQYPILVNAFKKHLYNPDPAMQGKVRTHFKDYVNRLATVSLENNMKFIILRPEFRPSEGHPSTLNQKQDAMRQAKQISATQRETTGAPIMLQARSDQKIRQESLATDKSRQDTQQQQQQMLRYQRPQQQIQPPKLSPQKHDQMDALHISQGHDQRRKMILANQLPSPRQEMQHLPQQSVHPSFAQANRSSSNKSRELINTYHLDRTDKPVPYVNSSPSSYEKSLPPTPQYHSRTQSQPAPNRDHFHQHQQYASQHNQIINSPLAIVDNNAASNSHLRDDSAFLITQPPPPHSNGSSHRYASSPIRSLHQPVSSIRQDTPIVQRTPSTVSQQMPPPKPPPRRRQSTASLFKPSPTKPIEKISRDSSQDRARKNVVGRVRDHASRFSTSASTSDLSSLAPKRNSSMKENRLSRESVFSGIATGLQRNGSQTRSRSSHRGEDESDSSSLQPIDPLRRKWAIEASSCNYNNLISLLREDPKLASCKDIVNGYTALHWAAKFGNLDIIKLIAGAHHVFVDTKSSGGHTPLHVAYMFKRLEAARVLTESYEASENVRDHSGKKPKYYLQSS